MDWLLGSGELEAPRLRAVSIGLAAILVGGAALVLVGPRGRGMARVHAAGLSLVLLGPLAGEGVLRLGLGLDLGELRDPKRYADPYADDDYWRLKRGWASVVRTQPDPELGWSTPVLPRNPLGIIRPRGYEPRRERVLLCFGDSFMAGATPHPHKIPDLLEERLDGWTAYNYGVGGYGVGQMLLRFRRAAPDFVEPVVVVGVMTRDLDRSILSCRGSPKPRFRLRAGELVVDAPAPSESEATWDGEHPPELRSYLVALLVRRARRAREKERGDDGLYRAEEKRELNRALLEAFTREAREQGLTLLFVTFPPSRQLRDGGWREDFLARPFEELEVPWVNGRQALRADMRDSGRPPGEYFLPDNHPGELGNRVLADAIAARLERMFRKGARKP